MLEKINSPQDLKKLKKEELPKLCQEIRDVIIKTVSQTGGHLASSLATVEAITALHYVFNVPKDKIIFDVGHQAYAHKIITGRKDKFHTLRQYGGISGFPNIEESEYDAFTTGHSSTAVSVALGFAVKRDFKKEDYKVIAFIGDGSLTGGLCYEGLNNAGHLKTDLLVILNDNEMFISHRVGAIANLLARLMTLGIVKRTEKEIELFLRKLHYVGTYLLRVAKRFKLLLFPGMLFEEMGFSYIGPINGHDIILLVDVLSKIKRMRGPIVLHILTKKGKGYKPAEERPIEFHGVIKFEIESGEFIKEKAEGPTYTDVFSDTIVELAKENKDIIAITAAMSEGTGLYKFAKEFPERFFDVGIAEQHALSFAAGLAKSGLKPICAIYSTFLQRGFDQLIHDIALSNLPVIIAIDRAGIVGEDGATHQGCFDLSYLRLIPNFVVMSPKDGDELRDMLFSALKYNCPVGIRYPRRHTKPLTKKEFTFIEKGKSEIIKEGRKFYILSIGDVFRIASVVIDELNKKGYEFGFINMRFLKPLDYELLDKIKLSAEIVITIEENTLIGGFGSAVKEYLSDSKIIIRSFGLPDKFIEHGSQKILLEKYNLSVEKIFEEIVKML